MISTLHPRRIFAVHTMLERRGPEVLDEIVRLTGYDDGFCTIGKSRSLWNAVSLTPG